MAITAVLFGLILLVVGLSWGSSSPAAVPWRFA
jgi:hypothetical protein